MVTGRSSARRSSRRRSRRRRSSPSATRPTGPVRRAAASSARRRADARGRAAGRSAVARARRPRRRRTRRRGTSTSAPQPRPRAQGTTAPVTVVTPTRSAGCAASTARPRPRGRARARGTPGRHPSPRGAPPRSGSTIAVNTTNAIGAPPTTIADSRAWADCDRASAAMPRRSRNDAASPSSAAALRPPMLDATTSAPAVARTSGRSRSMGQTASASGSARPSSVRAVTRRRSAARGPPPSARAASPCATVPPPRRCAATCSSPAGSSVANRRDAWPFASTRAIGPPASTSSTAGIAEAGRRRHPQHSCDRDRAGPQLDRRLGLDIDVGIDERGREAAPDAGRESPARRARERPRPLGRLGPPGRRDQRDDPERAGEADGEAQHANQPPSGGVAVERRATRVGAPRATQRAGLAREQLADAELVVAGDDLGDRLDAAGAVEVAGDVHDAVEGGADLTAARRASGRPTSARSTSVSRRERASSVLLAWTVESEPSWPVFSAWSMSSASPPRTSPTTMRSGRIRSAVRTRSRTETAPAPSAFGGRASSRTTCGCASRSSAVSSIVTTRSPVGDRRRQRVQQRRLARARPARRRAGSTRRRPPSAGSRRRRRSSAERVEGDRPGRRSGGS